MNKKLVFALMTGTHHCVFHDKSGNCSRCGKMHAPHTFWESTCTICGKICAEHQWNNGKCGICNTPCEHPAYTASGVKTHTCQVCRVALSHSYTNGTCRLCGYKCSHENGWRALESGHRCKDCNQVIAHDYIIKGSGNGVITGTCRLCTVCGYSKTHYCPDATETLCGTCAICGIPLGAHSFIFGVGTLSSTCSWCGYKCLHPSHTSYICDICHKGFRKEDCEYHVDTTIYAGSYVESGIVNGQRYYKQYVYENCEWIPGDYYLVKLNIPTPTVFGGDYAYTASGFVFTSDISSFPISPALVEGTGKYKVSLTQYTLDGKIIASKEDYSSSDCPWGSLYL